MTIDPIPAGPPIHKDDITPDDVAQAFDGMRGERPTVRSFSVYPMSEATARRTAERKKRRRVADQSRRINRR